MSRKPEIETGSCTWLKVGKNLDTPNAIANTGIFLRGGGGPLRKRTCFMILFLLFLNCLLFFTIYVKPLFLSCIFCKKNVPAGPNADRRSTALPVT